jgi:hypothetical protein
MPNRSDFYTGQLVSQVHLDEAFSDMEDGMRAIVSDFAMRGVMEGLDPVQHAGTANLTVDVPDGVAYAPNGERMRAAVLANVNCAVDHLGVSTTVVTLGHFRIISLLMSPDRTLSDPQTDSGGDTVYYRRGESYRYEIVQGTAGAIPTAPAIPSGSILLADIHILQGMTQIFANDIYDVRRQYSWAGFVQAAIEQSQANTIALDAHLDGSPGAHTADQIVYGGSGFWADGASEIPFGNVEGAITLIVSALSDLTTSSSGARLLGVESDASVSPTLAAQTLRERLVALRLASNLAYAGSGAWADASSLAASTVEAAIDAIVDGLAVVTGAAKIGAAASGTLGAGTVRSQLDELGTEKAALAGAAFSGAVTVADVTVTGTNRVKLASRSITRMQTVKPTATVAARWDLVADGTMIQTVDADSKLVIPLRVPHGATLTSVTVIVQAAAGHAGLPTTKASLEVVSVDDAYATTLIGTQGDPSANAAAYELVHPITETGLSVVINRETTAYYATLSAERGPTNYVNNFRYIATKCTYTITAMDED